MYRRDDKYVNSKWNNKLLKETGLKSVQIGNILLYETGNQFCHAALVMNLATAACFAT